MLLIGCKKETPATTPAKATEEKKPVLLKKECYSYDAKGSKIELRIEYKGSDVTGTLTYALSEKDSNKGTFVGKLENNILLLDYTFQSEGTESTRQVAFQVINNTLLEGYGEMTLDGTHFKDVAQIKFTSTMPLKKIECL